MCGAEGRREVGRAKTLNNKWTVQREQKLLLNIGSCYTQKKLQMAFIDLQSFVIPLLLVLGRGGPNKDT